MRIIIIFYDFKTISYSVDTIYHLNCYFSIRVDVLVLLISNIMII